MENIYETIIEKVRNGDSFRVDFKSRKLTVNGKSVELDADNLGIDKYDNLDDWLDKVEDLYDDYKYSSPTKRSMAKERTTKFKALSLDELVAECGHNAMSSPINRDEAQARLEIFILFSLLNGSFNPDELFAKDWFFQGSDKSLIIRKDWF